MNTMKKIKANQKGFTLVELIVVVAILGVLAAVAAPNYMNYLYKSRVSADVSTARAILNAARTMYMTSGDLSKITLENVLDDADLGEVKPATGGDDFGDIFEEIDTTDANDFKITVNPGTKAGKYNASLEVTERTDIPEPAVGSKSE